MPIIIPEGNHRRVVQSSDAAHIKCGLNLLNDHFWVLVLTFRIIVVLGLAKVRPFGQIDAVFITFIA
jgi:hypothetical protein